MRRLRATVLPVTDEHGILAGHLDWSHKDPFDRMLAAQAVLEDATLVSADAAFDSAPGVRRLWS
ncbi:MAG: PIN domain-containing protein [Propionibacteriaceae bacterium]|nr:PIN domain-containing protein [Propionibacteriaceae bacterium]